ncbi:MAG: integrase catalytic domain-containing protein, partial [Methylovulum sp.]
VPFLPELVAVMERHGHLRLPAEVRTRLLSISASTTDRLLRPERESIKLGVSTTRSGNLLKHQIQVRTFAEWDDVTPGFLEADLVAHCGGNTNGPFLNTLVLVDIATGWLECIPLLRKCASDVIDGLRVVDELLPFPMLGLDTDCGSEFINYDLLDYCEDRKITFTRARTHRKNDQAHIEEKNGSVVRRLVGYDRLEGRKAWEALVLLYRVLRKYINYFQPSLKLIEKERSGAKVSKKYDPAKTPYQRVLLSEHISQATKDSLTREYESIDPVDMLTQMEKLQDQLWTFSWNKHGKAEEPLSVCTDDEAKQDPEKSTVSRYYRTSRITNFRKAPRTWRTRKDPFEKVWDEIRLRLELMPETTAKEIIAWLMGKYPNQYVTGQTRTLQRRIAEWRQTQQSLEQNLRTLMLNEKSVLTTNSALTSDFTNNLDCDAEFSEMNKFLT